MAVIFDGLRIKNGGQRRQGVGGGRRWPETGRKPPQTVAGAVGHGVRKEREERSVCVNFTWLRMNEFTWMIFIPQKEAFT